VNTKGIGVATGLIWCHECGRISGNQWKYTMRCGQCNVTMDRLFVAREVYENCLLVYDEVGA